MNANTEQSELIERATIYRVSSFSITKTEVREAVYYRGDYAQYRDALFIECVVKGKRKRVRFTDSHNKTTVLVRGWDNPEPPSTMVEVQSSSSFTVTTARWASYDPRYKGLFNDWLIEQQDALDVIVDVREERRSLAEIEAEVNEKEEREQVEREQEAAERAARIAAQPEPEPKPVRSYRDVGDIAKDVRTQLKKEFPACKFSVTIDRYSMGQSMTVALMAAPFPVSLEDDFDGYGQLNQYTIRQERPDDGRCNGQYLTPRAWQVLQRAEQIANAENWDDSDAMTDYYSVNYGFSLHIGKWDKSFEQVGNDGGEVATATAVTTPEPEQPGDSQNVSPFEITYQGTWTWVKFEEKPAQPILDALNGNGLGFRWSKKRSAWYAREVVEEATIRQAIAQAVGVVKSEEETVTAVPPSSPEPQQPERKGDPVLAAKLRVYADGLDKAISRKRDTFAGANVTRRRAGMIAQANKEADGLERVQQILRALADLHDAGDVPDFLAEVKHKKTAVTLEEDVARLSYNEKIGSTAKLWGYKEIERYFASYDAYLQAVNWARSVIDGNHDPEAAQRNKLRQMVNEAKLAGIPGYFATPEAVQDNYLFQELDLQPGDLVLEPSAGDGRLADGLVKRFPGIELHCGEISYTLRKILEVKGYTLVSDDFLEYQPGEIYDAIVMNPPFENQADIDHIRHAFTLLKPGGTLVSVTSRGWTFRSDNKATTFRQFVDEHGWGDDLPDGSFDSEGTGVSTSYVTLTK